MGREGRDQTLVAGRGESGAALGPYPPWGSVLNPGPYCKQSIVFGISPFSGGATIDHFAHLSFEH